MLSQIEREFQEYDDHKSWVEIFKVRHQDVSI